MCTSPNDIKWCVMVLKYIIYMKFDFLILTLLCIASKLNEIHGVEKLIVAHLMKK